VLRHFEKVKKKSSPEKKRGGDLLPKGGVCTRRGSGNFQWKTKKKNRKPAPIGQRPRKRKVADGANGKRHKNQEKKRGDPSLEVP